MTPRQSTCAFRFANWLFYCPLLTFLLLTFLLLSPLSASVEAQTRPLETQDPQPLGTGIAAVSVGLSYARDEVYTLSGLKGNVWQLPVIGINVGIGPIADFQITGGPYNRLSITERRMGPLAGAVTSIGDTTHAVEDIVIGTKIRLVPEAERRPGVGFRFAVRLPNAKHESGMGQDTTDFSASLLGGKSIGPLRAVANVGLTIMSEPLDAARQNDVLTYGLSVVRMLDGPLEVLGEVNGRWSTRSGAAPIGTESRGTLKIGGRYTSGAVRFDAAAFFGLTAIDPTAGIMAGMTYTFKAFSLSAP
jgi:hypothetical protein